MQLSDPGRCGAPQCYVNGYGAYSHREYQSYAFEEGFADWVSASVFNDRTQDQGTFTWFGTAHDMRWYNLGAGILAGGHLKNECAAFSGNNPSYATHATREDFQRLLWRWRANLAVPCGTTITVQDVFDLYRGLRLGTVNAQGNNWPLISTLASYVSSQCGSSFEALGVYHGVKN